MSKFNHLFDIAFSVISEKENPDTITGRELRDALLVRIASMDDSEFVEACEYLSDTFEMTEGESSPSSLCGFFHDGFTPALCHPTTSLKENRVDQAIEKPQFPVHYTGRDLKIFTNSSGEVFVENTKSGVHMRINATGGGLQFTTNIFTITQPIIVNNMIGWVVEGR
jgi:hypothetical protein